MLPEILDLTTKFMRNAVRVPVGKDERILVVQVCLFSATMPPEIRGLTTKFVRDAVRIPVKRRLPRCRSRPWGR